MKKVTIPDHLDLSKEIIAALTEEQLQEVEGGSGPPQGMGSCWFCSCFTANDTETQQAS